MTEPEYICDTSRMRKAPPRSRYHWLFALLLMAAFAGALWQHGHAGLTVGLLTAVPFFAASVYLPYRWVNSLARAIANCFIFCGAVGWAVWRARENCPDLIMVEGLCIASLIFMAGGRPKDYFYLFFISIFLLIYGALIPRMAHLYLTAIAIVLLLFLAFSSRAAALAGVPPIREIRSKWRRIWHPMVIQILLAAVAFWYIFALMPLKNNDAPGLFETSFLTERDTALPPEISSWLRPKKIKISEKADKVIEPNEKAQKPTQPDEKGTPANLRDPVSKSIIEGNGSGSQGQDLVFYVKSGVKLYHLARLYDVYDGTQWKASPRLERVRIRDYNVKAAVRTLLVDQKYTLVKLISRRLYGGFRPYSFFSENNASMALNRSLKSSFYGAELQETPSEMPLTYNVSVQLLIPLAPPEIHSAKPDASSPQEPEPSAKARGKKRKAAKKTLPPDPAWVESISKQNYLTLPHKKISARVRDLASRITAGNLTPYGKALALRDHLRKTYPYRLEAQPVPPGKEPADYFLFELKQGHCEYFACALAVLARSAGLPSRVAVGFSPGNYNTLSNMFEIYEYHAHAWTQIYIERLGWLTMDATPPSAIQSRTLPTGLGQLRDPFDDEWRITPPELTEKTQQFLKNELLANLRKKDDLSTIDSALVEMVKAQEQIQEKVENKYAGAMKEIKKSGRTGFLFRMKQLWRRFSNSFKSMFSSLYDFLFTSWPVILSALMLCWFGYRFFRMCFILCRRQFKSGRIKKLRKKAGELCRTDPRQAVLDIYTALRLSLELAGYERGTLELLDFADRLGSVNRDLGESARIIFLLYYKAEYSSIPLSGADAEKAIARYDSLRCDSGSSFVQQ